MPDPNVAQAFFIPGITLFGTFFMAKKLSRVTLSSLDCERVSVMVRFVVENEVTY